MAEETVHQPLSGTHFTWFVFCIGVVLGAVFRICVLYYLLSCRRFYIKYEWRNLYMAGQPLGVILRILFSKVFFNLWHLVSILLLLKTIPFGSPVFLLISYYLPPSLPRWNETINEIQKGPYFKAGDSSVGACRRTAGMRARR